MTTFSYVLIHIMLASIIALIVACSIWLARKIDNQCGVALHERQTRLNRKIDKMFDDLRNDCVNVRPSDIDMLRVMSTAYLSTSRLFLKRWKEWIASSAYVEWINYWYRKNIC